MIAESAIPQQVRASNLIRAVRLELGQDAGFGVTAEISDSQIVYSIREAVSEYSRFYPLRSFQSFTSNVGQFVYTPDPALSGIYALSMIAVTDLSIQPIPHIGFYSGIITGYGTAVNYNMPYKYAVFMEWKNAVEKTFSQQPAWCFLPEVNKLYIYSPAKMVKVSIEGSIEHDSAFDEEVLWSPEEESCGEPSKAISDRLDKALSSINPSNMRFVRRLALAKSMQILGRIRSKYGSIPTVEGKETQLDGAAMLAEGQALWESTREELRKSTFGKFRPVLA